MNLKWKRVIAVFLTISICLGSFTACSYDNAPAKVVFTTGFGKDEVFRIGDISCKEAEIMVYLTTMQNQYEDIFGAEIWNVQVENTTLEENIKGIVLAKIAQIKTMYLLAKSKGIELSDEEETWILQAASEYMESLTQEEIDSFGVEEELIQEMYREYALANKVYTQLVESVNPEISDDEARIIKVQYIFFQTYAMDATGNKVEYSQDSKEGIYTEAKNVLQLATEGGQDFMNLATTYSDDENFTLSFGRGGVEKALEDVAFQLENDEISNVIETTSGFYILKCTSTFDKDETDANKLKIIEQRKKDAFGIEYDVFTESLLKNLNEKLWQEVKMLHSSEITTQNFFEIYEKKFN